MRKADIEMSRIFSMGPYTVVKRAWERQYAVFHRGRCVHVAIKKTDAIQWVVQRKSESE